LRLPKTIEVKQVDGKREIKYITQVLLGCKHDILLNIFNLKKLDQKIPDDIEENRNIASRLWNTEEDTQKVAKPHRGKAKQDVP
jgi:glucose-6-phosphate-specific signal transduction histidine kinase